MTASKTRAGRGLPTPEATIDALKERVDELEANAAAAARSAQTQAALYRIASLASGAGNMAEFYAGIHAVLGELVYAENIYIALYDDDRRQMLGEGYSTGLTGYVLRSGRLLHVNAEAAPRKRRVKAHA